MCKQSQQLPLAVDKTRNTEHSETFRMKNYNNCYTLKKIKIKINRIKSQKSKINKQVNKLK